MNNTIGNNRFYNTFSPFISEKTRSAEKTMNGSCPVEKPKTPRNIGRTFYKYISAGGFLLVPIAALFASRVHMGRMMKKLDLEYFLAVNNEFAGGFLKGISTKITMAKYKIINTLAKTLKPLRVRKDLFFHRLNAKKNTSFASRTLHNINQFFKNQRIFATGRQDKKVKMSLVKLEQKLEGLLNTIQDSKDGKLKIVVQKILAENPADEFPRIIDVSKTAKGENRVAEIRKLLGKIKSYLSSDNPDYSKILRKITYSCEDVFESAQNVLVKCRKHLQHKRPKDLENGEKFIKDIFDDLIKYRYAERIGYAQRTPASITREEHIINALKKIKLLKQNISPDRITMNYLKELESILIKDANPSKMGLVEQIRCLLKCNDISSQYIKKDFNPALLKQCRPDDYIEVKKALTDFAESIKHAHVSKQYMLPTYLAEIDRGKIITNTLATALPAGALLTNYFTAENDKDKTEHKRNFYSFMAGAAIMMGTHHFAVFSRIKSIIAGIITSFVTAKVYDKLPRNKNTKNS